MKRKLVEIFLILPWVLIGSCDADLFKTADEIQDPIISEIESTAEGFTLNVGDTAKFWITASDPDGRVLSYIWAKDDGEFVSTSDEPEVTWRAPFKGGDYTINVEVSNGDKQVSRSKIIRVISSEKPVVRIIKPVRNEYLVQYETLNIQVEAFHDNGISAVELFANELFVGNLTEKGGNIFKYDWIIDASAGTAIIRVLAQARSIGTQNEDSTIVRIEGVIPGKK